MFLKFIEIFIIICGSVFVLSAFMILRNLFRAFYIGQLRIEELSLSKKSFVYHLIEWCQNNISYDNTSKPDFTIKYYAHSKYAARYHTVSRKCIFYIYQGQKIREIVNNVIHEFVHARQHNEDNLQLYDKFNQEFGYEKNPYEVEARKVANKYEDDCLLWIYDRVLAK